MKHIAVALAVLAGTTSLASVTFAAGSTGGRGNPSTTPAVTQDVGGYWEYGAWRVSVDVVDTGEDVRRSCRASTGGDGDPVVEVFISNGDAGPPYAYPSVVVNESAPRGHITYMKDKQQAYVWFDDEDTIDGQVTAYHDDEGIPQADLAFHSPKSQWVLQAMRRNGQMDVVVDHKVFFTAFLDGFTASYLKMMEQCGFDGTGVVN